MPGSVLARFDPPDIRWGPGHLGVDLAGRAGETVVAAADGVVTFAEVLAGRGVVVVDHGTVRTTYEPVAAGVLVGEAVGRGHSIGRLEAGHPSCAGTTCLHWGLRAGDTYLDPLLLLGGAVRLLPASASAATPQSRPVGDAAAPGTSPAVAATAPETGTSPEPDASAGTETSPEPDSPPTPEAVPSSSPIPVPVPVSLVTTSTLRMPVSGPVTSGYGMRRHPLTGVWKLHDGTDIGAACGTPIRAAAAGTVVSASFAGAYGNRVVVDHGTGASGTVTTGYAHARAFTVSVGDHVSAGQVIAIVGSTGLTTGCHLHVQVWLSGRLVDPMTVIS